MQPLGEMSLAQVRVTASDAALLNGRTPAKLILFDVIKYGQSHYSMD
jgi:hypothetical protein